MNEPELQRTYNYPLYPRDSKIYSEKGFIETMVKWGEAIGVVF